MTNRSFTPASFVALGRWARYVAFALLIEFIAHGLPLAYQQWLRQGKMPHILYWYTLLFALPAIVLLSIHRWIEDGYEWAFAVTSTIAAIIFVPMLMDCLASYVIFLALLMAPVRLLAAVLIAWPDVRDVARDRKRRYGPRGFEPIVAPRPPGAISPAEPAELNPSRRSHAIRSASPRILPVPRTEAPISAHDSPPSFSRPIFLPESLIKAHRNIRSLGFALIFLFLFNLIFAAVAAAQFEHSLLYWIELFGSRVLLLLLPGFAAWLLAPLIEAGLPWAVGLIAGANGLAIVAAWTWGGFELTNLLYRQQAVGVFVPIIAAICGGMIVVFCIFVWSDVRDVSRATARAKKAESQPPRKSGSLFEAKQRSELGNNP